MWERYKRSGTYDVMDFPDLKWLITENNKLYSQPDIADNSEQ